MILFGFLRHRLGSWLGWSVDSICKPAVDKESLIDWVARFLNYWEDESMLYRPAATIIVEYILNAQNLSQDLVQKGLSHLPEPESYFPECEGL